MARGIGRGDRVERLAYDPKEGLIRLRTHSEGARVLVVSENYQSNWSVWVDGEEAEMVRVNYVWKGGGVAGRGTRGGVSLFFAGVGLGAGGGCVGVGGGCGRGGGGVAAAAAGWLTNG